MHIHSFEIANIRSLSKLQWTSPRFVSHGKEPTRAGWHVIIGDNGSGKSTLLKSLALALIGPRNAEGLWQDWGDWLRAGETNGRVEVQLKQYKEDVWAGQGAKLKNYFAGVGVALKKDVGRVMIQPLKWSASSPDRHAWSDKPGWFAASFGPFRRFTGGDKDAEKLYYSHPRLARHLSVFGENVALSECISWLSQLRFEQLEQNPKSDVLLEGIKSFLNQDGFLPHGVKFSQVSSKNVLFTDGEGLTVSVNSLGDGFRSILSLTFELLRQMTSAWPRSTLFDTSANGGVYVRHSGVVLIDEIDAHLHPVWQRRIGFWLTKHFPNIQFIVATHSPLVCHAAERGSIFRLPTPGSGQSARMVTDLERDRLVFGSVLDAYGTELFGSDISRSESAKLKQARLAMLNQKALNSDLTELESQERSKLLSIFPAPL